MKFRIVKFVDGWYGLQEHLFPFHFFPFTLFGWFTLYISMYNHPNFVNQKTWTSEFISDGRAAKREICEEELSIRLEDEKKEKMLKSKNKIIEVIKC